jgi:hypothetical protein
MTLSDYFENAQGSFMRFHAFLPTIPSGLYYANGLVTRIFNPIRMLLTCSWSEVKDTVERGFI